MKKSLIAIASAAIFSAGAAFSADVEARFQPGSLSFSGGTGFTNAVLTVTGPDDFEKEETAKRGLPVFRVVGGRMRDGFYQFSLSAATDEKVKIKKPLNNGRGDAGRDHTFVPFHMSGIFEISRGTIVPPEKLDASADGDKVSE